MIILRLFTFAVVILLTAGCQKEYGARPAQPAQTFDSAGKRVLVVDGEGETIFKIRRLEKRLKIYSPTDRTLIANVRTSEDEVRVHDRRSKSDTTFRLDTTGDSVAVDSSVRLERVENGWALMGPQSTTLGYVAPIESGWAFRQSYSSAPQYISKRDDRGRATVMNGSTVAWKTYDRELSPAAVLVLGLDTIDPVTRVLLALWLDRQTVEDD